MNSTLLRSLAIFLALGAIVTAFIGYRLSTQPPPPKPVQAPPTYPQVVAAHDIPAGQVLAATDVRLASVLQPDSRGYASVDQVVGKMTRVAVAGNAPLLPSHFPTLGAMAQTLRPGERGVAVKVNEVIGAGGFLNPGDHVDVLLYLRASKETGDASSAQVVLRDLRVLAFGEKVPAEENGKPEQSPKASGGKPDGAASARNKPELKRDKESRYALLAVPEQEVARLMLAESGGTLRLALRGAEPPQQAQGGAQERYLELADLARPGKPAPVPTTVHRVTSNPGAGQKARRTAPVPEQKFPVIVHRGDKTEMVSVSN